jgi:DNA-binding CsgD family transcriptional regulator
MANNATGHCGPFPLSRNDEPDDHPAEKTMTMHRDIGQLSDREKQILRLLARGHDAEPAARMPDISIHTGNERLRDARGELGVFSIREAPASREQAG